MAKVANYMVIMTVTMILLGLYGVDIGTTALLNGLGLSSGTLFGGSTLYLELLALFGSVAAAVTIGYFTKTSPESILILSIANYVAIWGLGTLFGIYNYFGSICPSGSDCAWIGNMIKVIFGGLIAGFFISIIQWWRGND